MIMSNKGKKLHYAWWIAVACCAIYAGSVGIVVACAGLFYKHVSTELGVGTADIVFYTTLMYFVITITLPFAGKIFSKINMRLLLSIAALADALAFGLMGTYTSVYQFYVSGVILGIANSFLIYAAVPLIINNWFKVKMGTVLGLSMTFMGIGGAISAPIAGYLIETIGWRPSYMVLGAIVAVITLPFTIFVIRKDPKEKNMTAYGAEIAETSSKKVVEETGTSLKHAIKSIPFYALFIFTGFLGLVVTVNFHIPNHLLSEGFSTSYAATVVTCVMIGQTSGKFIIGWLNDKIGIKLTSFIGIGSGMIGILLILFSGTIGGASIYIGGLAFGIGYSCSTLLPPFMIKTVFGNRDYASIYSMIMSASTLAIALGTTIFGFAYDLTGSYYVVFLCVLAIQVLSILIGFMLLRRKAVSANNEAILAVNEN
ncbi:MFS transporter [Bacillus benzoevorans]|uniref:MFS family permease n=1 Tax=Bacillus benzoevorans TaxID=1456 RepID=A0A7X0HSU4_9BACI|nr:MFS transporter [Bacillus benzoevorans]MBB6446213.1 MFS family permease [Bacillus benzoevorans]